ncbi:MAG: hypothetical protein B6U89_00735 [Desulfurococcales archaeon ex4484_58]|nr:MAG: hypothetical protein B6U89_00735 [Desulfurococcales archaeon ex4484_58]
MHKLGFIGGTGTIGLFPGVPTEIDTLYGRIEILLAKTEPRIVYVPRHGFRQQIPPNEVNYRAIIDALLYHGVKHIVSTTIATRLKEEYGIGDIVVPHDIIDLTSNRQQGFDPSKKIFVDMRNVFSEELRRILIEKARETGFTVHDRGVVIVIDGPRFETPAEAKMYRMLGGDLISMSLAPEAFMAKEAGLEYVAIAIILNDPADKAPKKSREEIIGAMEKIRDKIRDLILKVAKEVVK